ncbi:hypothetical protein DUI87_01383 [Hirundo rustica rustica]|uniref:BTB domain-containing protein n=1 Tax=Hirundo rustica rustica TaxID=333673 RepID=A0A3M0L4I0_HIRRU|nr:hypothetical protein DUI87_01383 [Hirundo rustica rustica]
MGNLWQYSTQMKDLLKLRSLVEEEDPHMKVPLGSSDMGVSAHLQSLKTGTTRFFTSNTHSSVVLQGFDQLRVEGLLCDVTLVPGDGDEVFPVHRAMMASASDYFKAMFTECYIWALKNRTQPLWGGVKNYFLQSFRPGTAVFKSIEFSLGAKDSIILLLVLLCLLFMACTILTMLRNQTLHGVVQRLLEEEGKRNKCKTTASMSTQAITEETETAPTQTVTEEKGTKNKATVSVSTQAVTEEKETKGAISISTQTVIEAEQPKPVAVAPVQKKKSKSKSVRIVTDEDVTGPSHPAEETEPEIITHCLSLGELHDLWKEFTCQTNESILTWLLHIWDAAANATILDGSEARQLGSLSRDVVIDQGMGRTQQNSQPLAVTANKCEGQICL